MEGESALSYQLLYLLTDYYNYDYDTDYHNCSSQ